MDRFERVKTLFGNSTFHKFSTSSILLIGVGGVGSWTLDCLYRTGIQNITIVDFDRYDETNRNRQIGSDNNVGRKKVERLKELYPNIETMDIRVSPEFVEGFDFYKYDLVIDAIDEVDTKVALAHKVYYKLISSMGSANLVTPAKIEISSIWKTKDDPLARVVRNRLRKTGFDKDYRVVFSPGLREGEKGGSFVGVTGAFGLHLCSYAVQYLGKRENEFTKYTNNI